MSFRLGLVAGSPCVSRIVPAAVATTSRQPIRSWYDVSLNVIRADRSVRAGVSGARMVQVRRRVERPPAPAGNSTDDEPGAGVRATPSRSRARLGMRLAQAAVPQAAASSSLTLPSSSASIRWRSWNVGISAMSITTSRSIRSGAIVSPA